MEEDAEYNHRKDAVEQLVSFLLLFKLNDQL